MAPDDDPERAPGKADHDRGGQPGSAGAAGAGSCRCRVRRIPGGARMARACRGVQDSPFPPPGSWWHNGGVGPAP